MDYQLNTLPPPDLPTADAAATWLAEQAPLLIRACRWALMEARDPKDRGAAEMVLLDVETIVGAVAAHARGGPGNGLQLETDELDWPNRTEIIARFVNVGLCDRPEINCYEPPDGFKIVSQALVDRVRADTQTGQDRINARNALRLPAIEREDGPDDPDEETPEVA